MTKNSNSNPNSAASPPISVLPRLLTREQVLAEVRSRIAASSLTEVASRTGISPQQLSDIVHGRANLSKKALHKLRYRLVEFYEKVGG